MKFTPTSLPGVFVVDIEPRADERGFFARTFCTQEFARHGLESPLAQCSISFNALAGTVRGMHWQAAPHEEAKLVRVTLGAISDRALDLRRSSPAYRRSVAVELSADDHRMLYLPRGVAHGFQTLRDNTEVSYQIGTAYVPEAARGARWDDPAFDIAWPLPVARISPKDLSYPAWSDDLGFA